MTERSLNQADPPSEDIDLYCLECGYNLRGLTGDPRRCPECFHMNPLGDLVIPAREIKRQIRKMETGATVCVAAMIIALLGLREFLIFRHALVLVCAGLTVAVPWCLGAAHFANSCGHRAGWHRALARYHFYGGCMLGLGLGAWLAWEYTRQEILGLAYWVSRVRFLLVQFGIMGLLGGVLYVLFRWMYRQARRDFDQLQRELAVHIIRTRHRRLLEGRR